MRYNAFVLLIILSCVAVAAGCVSSGEQPPQAAMDAANVTADRIFADLNTDNYSDFSSNFSAPMLAAFNETAFHGMTKTMVQQYGRYESRAAKPSAAVVGNYNIFVYECQFEKTKLNVQLTMNKTDVYSVEGFFYR
jgi:hypothetical protein